VELSSVLIQLVLLYWYSIAASDDMGTGIAASCWYRGVTVLLAGWFIWKSVRLVHANSPPREDANVRTTVFPMGENGTIPLLTFLWGRMAQFLY
jgi:hypothetical protein